MAENTKVKKKFYKKWWFWVLIVVIGTIANLGSSEEEAKETATQPKTEEKQDVKKETKDTEKETKKEEAEKKEKTDKPKLKMDEEGFFKDIEKLSNDTNNIIIAARKNPLHNDGYKWIEVVISDAWYNSPEHEKKRFAKLVSNKVEQIAKDRELIEKDEHVMVDLVDSYGEVIAEEGVWSGEMKIKQ